MEVLLESRRVRHDRGPEEELHRARRRNRAAWRRHDRAMRLRRFCRQARLPALVAILAIWPIVELTILSPWPMTVTLRHWQAHRNCDAARAVGLAPARRGEPGYWERLDADADGISCEPWPYR